jgi:hypothetical protein
MSTQASGHVVSVPVLVHRAMRRCAEDHVRAARLPHRTPAQRAIRSELLASVMERRARWWGVLLRHVLHQGDIRWVFGLAAMEARERAESDAKFWREAAEHWRGDTHGIDPHDETGFDADEAYLRRAS